MQADSSCSRRPPARMFAASPRSDVQCHRQPHCTSSTPSLVVQVTVARPLHLLLAPCRRLSPAEQFRRQPTDGQLGTAQAAAATTIKPQLRPRSVQPHAAPPSASPCTSRSKYSNCTLLAHHSPERRTRSTRTVGRAALSVARASLPYVLATLCSPSTAVCAATGMSGSAMNL